jgi:anti-sigma28 factor (negative regulator of flagellin synthesis)
MSSSHNKKRNTGLLYEFLIKTISSSLVENDKQRSAKALRIIKQSFKPGTELYREFRLINSLIKTTVSSEAVAASIISEAKNAARSIDFEALDRQKSILIKNINHQLQDENFYDQHVKEYKIFATVQGLVNGWRAKDVDLQRLAEYEDQLVKWLTSHKDEESPQKINENSVGTNRLVLKVMMKKLSEKYDGNLTPDQKSLIKAYAFSTANDDAGTMTKKMQEIREKLLESIESYISSEDSSLYLHERLMSIKEKLTEGVTKVDDSSISEYMLYAKLVEELTSGGSNG